MSIDIKVFDAAVEEVAEAETQAIVAVAVGLMYASELAKQKHGEALSEISEELAEFIDNFCEGGELYLDRYTKAFGLD